MVKEIRIYYEGDKLLKSGFNAFFKKLRDRATEGRCKFVLVSGKWDKSCAASIFWMVEMMESWFHADKDALEKFYGSGFNKGALRANPKVEEISKKDLKEGLQAATKGTQKGDYYENKTSHGQKLLELINPDLVESAAPNCKRLFTEARNRLA